MVAKDGIKRSVPLSYAPGMKARERGVDNVRPLPADVQQHQTTVGEEPVRAEGVLGVVPPGAVRELVEIRVGRHEEELLVLTAGFVSSSSSSSSSNSIDDLLSSSILAARGRVARIGQCGRRLVGEVGWHYLKGWDGGRKGEGGVDCRASRFVFYAPISVFLAFYEEVCANQDYIQNATTQQHNIVMDGWCMH